ncbi:hypothetical protein [Bradyrhizobium sp. SZCCHNR1015]|uniref:hypothetical protein n=1 Tax=Bradyrhizobium sp. SZCCHNR1015 TaxID=3057338 RepID=UPI002916FE99|nr:hypothetical protein [Bradyrhizobium sp. SZCCHNR1015]
MTSCHVQPADVATSAGRDHAAISEVVAGATNVSLQHDRTRDNRLGRAPRLTIRRNRGGQHRLWVKVEGVPLQYAAEVHELHTPLDLILRMFFDAYEDPAFLVEHMPPFERMLLRPDYDFEAWTQDVDAALAAIGLEAVDAPTQAGGGVA